MFAIVREKKRHRLLTFFTIGAGPERLFDQALRSLPHIPENLIVRQGRTAHLFEGGIHRESEINGGVDERPIKIEDEDANVRERRWVRI